MLRFANSRAPAAWLMLVAIAVLSGCRETTSTPADAPAAPEAAAEPAPELEIKITHWEGVQALVAEHSGQLVVVDLWSNW